MTNNDFVSPNFQIPLPNLAVKCCWFISFKHSKWIPHRGVMFSLVDKWIFFNAVKALTSSFPNDFFGFFSELIKCSLVKLHYFSNLLQIPWNCCDVNIDSLDRLNMVMVLSYWHLHLKHQKIAFYFFPPLSFTFVTKH